MKHHRKLNSVEQAMELLNRHQGSWNVITISRIQGNLDRELLRQSLDLVQLRHPRLRCQIVDRSSLDELYFVEAQDDAKIPLEVIFQTQQESWQDLVIRELNQVIDSNKYLMKCCLIYHQDWRDRATLITTIHHAICDGLSTVQLHSEILQNCHKIASKTIEPVEILPLLPAVEKLFPQWMNGISGTINQLIFLLKLQFKQKLYSLSTATVEELVPLKERSCGLVYKYLEPEKTQKLIQNCRQEKTSVQGALCAAILLAVVKKIKTLEAKKINLACNSYVDLRRRVDPQVKSEHLSFMASFITTFHRVDPQIEFWDLAREIYQQNQQGLKRGDIFKPIRYVRKIIEYFLSNADKVGMSAGVTNLGQINIPQEYGMFKLESINFAASNAVFPGFLLAAVTTYQKTMFFNFTFSRPAISQQQAENMANYSINLLTEICQSK